MNDPDLRVAASELFFEPATGLLIAVPEYDGPRGHLIHKGEQVLAIGMRGEIEISHLAAFGDLAAAGAEHEGFTRLGGL